MSEKFHKRLTVEQVEEGNSLSPKFDSNGLIPCVTTDIKTHEVLMVGYMNDEALTKTIENGEAYYCLLYTSPSPRDAIPSRMPSSA